LAAADHAEVDSGYRRWRPTSSHRASPIRRRALPGRRGPVAKAPVAERVAVARPGDADVVLDVRDLKTYFFTYDGVVRALDGVNLVARRGETTGVVGETGCGKSVTAFSITRLISHPGRVISGRINYRGADLLWRLDREAKFKRLADGRVKVIQNFRRTREANERLGSVRGRRIAMIFQEPMQAMNPVFSISDQLGETLLLHRGIEIVDGLLAADQRWRGMHGQLLGEVDFHGAAPEAASTAGDGGDALRRAVEALVETTATSEEELRRLSGELGRVTGLSTIGTEAFYIVRNSPPGDRRRRTRLIRSLRRIQLSEWKRDYLRHRRKSFVLKAQVDQLSFREMKTGKPAGFDRRKFRILQYALRARGLRFAVPALKRRLDRVLKDEVYWRSVQLLEGVRIANPTGVARGYPHELSGGMLQRVMIAMALSCEPDLLIADEPTTALDVTIQAQILELMRDLRERVGTAIILITHDLGVVAEVCDRVNVMYAGLVVETAPAQELFRRPLHPYAQGLLSSIPRFDQPDRELQTIPGSVPNLIRPPPGCRFHPRCPYAMPICKEVRPLPTVVGPEHTVSCHLYTVPPENQSGPAAAPLASAPTSRSGGTPA
jgi:oligopeptide/dipeptide ABC transporter ATP-binding protein